MEGMQFPAGCFSFSIAGVMIRVSSQREVREEKMARRRWWEAVVGRAVAKRVRAFYNGGTLRDYDY